ncbi:MAG: hypothetical protein ACRYE7_00310 [Janthinobacterium lividum]
MISLRKVTGLVIKEMTAYNKNQEFSEVNAEDFVAFIDCCHRQTLAKNICRIIFKMELDDGRTNLFNTWLIRKTPLLSVGVLLLYSHIITNYIRHIREF